MTPEEIPEPSMKYGEDIDGEEIFHEAFEGDMSMAMPEAIEDNKMTFAPEPLPSVDTVKNLEAEQKVLKTSITLESSKPQSIKELAEKSFGSSSKAHVIKAFHELLLLHRQGKHTMTQEKAKPYEVAFTPIQID